MLYLRQFYPVWKFAKADLFHWTAALNRLDEIMARVLKAEIDLHSDTFSEYNKSLVVTIISFMKVLLENSSNKYLFSSYDTIVLALSVFDIDILEVTLHFLYHPLSKYSPNKSLKTMIAYQLPFLEILAAKWQFKTFFQRSIPETLLMPELPEITNEGFLFTFYFAKKKSDYEALFSGSPAAPVEAASTGLSEILIPKEMPCPTFKESIELLAEKHGLIKEMWQSFGLRLNICWNIRKSRDILQKFIAIKLLALGIYINIAPESVLMTGLFAKQIDLLEQLATILRLDFPSSIEVKSAALLACCSIVKLPSKSKAMMEALQLGSPHGVVSVLFNDILANYQSEDSAAYEYYDHVVESCFHFLSSSLSSSSDSASLIVSSDIVPTLVKFIPLLKPAQLRIATKTISMIDNIFYGLNDAAFPSFFAADGLIALTNSISEVVIFIKDHSLIAATVNLLTDASSPPRPFNFEASLYHGKLKTMLKLMLHLMQSLGTSSQYLRGLIDSSLPGSIKLIIEELPIFGASLFSLAILILASFINNEPTALSFLHEHGLPMAFIKSLSDNKMPLSADVLTSLPHVFGAICLNSVVMQLFEESSLLWMYMETFILADYVSLLQEQDVIDIMGSALEEFSRHHPTLRPLIASYITRILNELLQTAQKYHEGDKKYVRNCSFVPIDFVSDATTIPDASGVNMTEPPTLEFSFIENFTGFLEFLLQNNALYKDLVGSDSSSLNSLINLYFHPALPFDFASSSASYNTSHLFRFIIENDPKLVIPLIMKALGAALKELPVDTFVEFTDSSYFARFIRLDSKSTLLDESISSFRSIARIHFLLGLLSDVFCAPSFNVFSYPSKSRVLINELFRVLFEDLKTSTIAKQNSILKDLFTCHRLLIWEHHLFKQSVKTVDSSIDDVNIAHNIKIIKYLLSQIPSTIIALVSALGRLSSSPLTVPVFSSHFNGKASLDCILIMNHLVELHKVNLSWTPVADSSPGAFLSYIAVVLAQVNVSLFDELKELGHSKRKVARHMIEFFLPEGFSILLNIFGHLQKLWSFLDRQAFETELKKDSLESLYFNAFKAWCLLMLNLTEPSLLSSLFAPKEGESLAKLVGFLDQFYSFFERCATFDFFSADISLSACQDLLSIMSHVLLFHNDSLNAFRSAPLSIDLSDVDRWKFNLAKGDVFHKCALAQEQGQVHPFSVVSDVAIAEQSLVNFQKVFDQLVLSLAKSPFADKSTLRDCMNILTLLYRILVSPTLVSKICVASFEASSSGDVVTLRNLSFMLSSMLGSAYNILFLFMYDIGPCYENIMRLLESQFLLVEEGKPGDALPYLLLLNEGVHSFSNSLATLPNYLPSVSLNIADFTTRCVQLLASSCTFNETLLISLLRYLLTCLSCDTDSGLISKLLSKSVMESLLNNVSKCALVFGSFQNLQKAKSTLKKSPDQNSIIIYFSLLLHSLVQIPDSVKEEIFEKDIFERFYYRQSGPFTHDGIDSFLDKSEHLILMDYPLFLRSSLKLLRYLSPDQPENKAFDIRLKSKKELELCSTQFAPVSESSYARPLLATMFQLLSAQNSTGNTTSAVLEHFKSCLLLQLLSELIVSYPMLMSMEISVLLEDKSHSRRIIDCVEKLLKFNVPYNVSLLYYSSSFPSEFLNSHGNNSIPSVDLVARLKYQECYWSSFFLISLLQVSPNFSAITGDKHDDSPNTMITELQRKLFGIKDLILGSILKEINVALRMLGNKQDTQDVLFGTIKASVDLLYKALTSKLATHAGSPTNRLLGSITDEPDGDKRKPGILSSYPSKVLVKILMADRDVMETLNQILLMTDMYHPVGESLVFITFKLIDLLEIQFSRLVSKNKAPGFGSASSLLENSSSVFLPLTYQAEDETSVRRSRRRRREEQSDDFESDDNYDAMFEVTDGEGHSEFYVTSDSSSQTDSDDEISDVSMAMEDSDEIMSSSMEQAESDLMVESDSSGDSESDELVHQSRNIAMVEDEDDAEADGEIVARPSYRRAGLSDQEEYYEGDQAGVWEAVDNNEYSEGDTADEDFEYENFQDDEWETASNDGEMNYEEADHGVDEWEDSAQITYDLGNRFDSYEDQEFDNFDDNQDDEDSVSRYPQMPMSSSEGARNAIQSQSRSTHQGTRQVAGNDDDEWVDEITITTEFSRPSSAVGSGNRRRLPRSQPSSHNGASSVPSGLTDLLASLFTSRRSAAAVTDTEEDDLAEDLSSLVSHDDLSILLGNDEGLEALVTRLWTEATQSSASGRRRSASAVNTGESFYWMGNEIAGSFNQINFRTRTISSRNVTNSALNANPILFQNEKLPVDSNLLKLPSLFETFGKYLRATSAGILAPIKDMEELEFTLSHSSVALTLPAVCSSLDTGKKNSMPNSTMMSVELAPVDAPLSLPVMSPIYSYLSAPDISCNPWMVEPWVSCGDRRSADCLLGDDDFYCHVKSKLTAELTDFADRYGKFTLIHYLCLLSLTSKTLIPSLASLSSSDLIAKIVDIVQLQLLQESVINIVSRDLVVSSWHRRSFQLLYLMHSGHPTVVEDLSMMACQNWRKQMELHTLELDEKLKSHEAHAATAEKLEGADDAVMSSPPDKKLDASVVEEQKASQLSSVAHPLDEAGARGAEEVPIEPEVQPSGLSDDPQTSHAVQLPAGSTSLAPIDDSIPILAIRPELDVSVLEVLPTDMQREVLMQYFEERRRNNPSTRVTLRVSPEYLDEIVNPEIRNLILAVEEEERRAFEARIRSGSRRRSHDEDARHGELGAFVDERFDDEEMSIVDDTQDGLNNFLATIDSGSGGHSEIRLSRVPTAADGSAVLSFTNIDANPRSSGALSSTLASAFGQLLSRFEVTSRESQAGAASSAARAPAFAVSAFPKAANDKVDYIILPNFLYKKTDVLVHMPDPSANNIVSTSPSSSLSSNTVLASLITVLRLIFHLNTLSKRVHLKILLTMINNATVSSKLPNCTGISNWVLEELIFLILMVINEEVGDFQHLDSLLNAHYCSKAMGLAASSTPATPSKGKNTGASHKLNFLRHSVPSSQQWLTNRALSILNYLLLHDFITTEGDLSFGAIQNFLMRSLNPSLEVFLKKLEQRTMKYRDFVRANPLELSYVSPSVPLTSEEPTLPTYNVRLANKSPIMVLFSLLSSDKFLEERSGNLCLLLGILSSLLSTPWKTVKAGKSPSSDAGPELPVNAVMRWWTIPEFSVQAVLDLVRKRALLLSSPKTLKSFNVLVLEISRLPHYRALVSDALATESLEISKGSENPGDLLKYILGHLMRTAFIILAEICRDIRSPDASVLHSLFLDKDSNQYQLLMLVKLIEFLRVERSVSSTTEKPQESSKTTAAASLMPSSTAITTADTSNPEKADKSPLSRGPPFAQPFPSPHPFVELFNDNLYRSILESLSSFFDFLNTADASGSPSSPQGTSLAFSSFLPLVESLLLISTQAIDEPKSTSAIATDVCTPERLREAQSSLAPSRYARDVLSSPAKGHVLSSPGGSKHGHFKSSSVPNAIMLGECIEKHRKIFNDYIKNTPSLLSGSFSLFVSHFPKLIDFDNKRAFFRSQLHKKTQQKEDHYGHPLTLTIRRDNIFEDSFHQLIARTGPEIKYGKLNVRFYDEEGIDAGGVTREWFSSLSRQMFNPDYALFKTSALDRITYQPNRSSYVNPEHLSYFKFIGRIIGKAIYDGKLLDCYFTRSFYKHLLNIPVDYKDMEANDPAFYNSLVWILENDITDVLDLTFSTEIDDFGVHKIVDLKPEGRTIAVTEASKHEYVKLVTEQRLTKAIQSQMNALIKGFSEIIPHDLLTIFNEQELELLISGLPEIDIDDWRNNTEYYGGFTCSSPQVVWFWRAVRSMDQEERAKLLQFATGTSKVPLEGFSALQGSSGIQKFQIHKNFESTDRLPTAHTCFNQLDLPVYESYEDLRRYLLVAINEGSLGFGFA